VGETPILKHKLTRDHVSVIGALSTAGKLYFGFQEKAYNSHSVIGFLEHLQRQIPGKLLLIWDGAPIHRSRVLKAYLASCEPERITIVPLPGYAPDLNPQEGIWRYLKYKELNNLACESLEHLKQELQKAIKRLRQKRKIIQACFAHAEGALQT